MWRHWSEICNFIMISLYSRFLHWHWNENKVILTKFMTLAAPGVVILTTSSAASDEYLIKMTSLGIQWTHREFRCIFCKTLQWRHNERDGVSNHQGLDYLLSLFFIRRSKKTSKLRVTGLCEGNSPVIGEFPAQKASNAENVSIWCRHRVMTMSGRHR